MAQRVTKRQLTEAIKAEITRGREYLADEGDILNGTKLAVFQAQISPRKWYVCFTFQPKTSQVGDTAIIPQPEQFSSQPQIVWAS